MSPSLRGSGLKFHPPWMFALAISVSLFTREWIEIAPHFWTVLYGMSPSLRGSGLKFLAARCKNIWPYVSLFTREWIEISSLSSRSRMVWSLPLYEGVDWNSGNNRILRERGSSPSLRGSGLKSFLTASVFVSLCLPLYEGVDWNYLDPVLFCKTC